MPGFQFTCVVTLAELFDETRSCMLEAATAELVRFEPEAAFTCTVNDTFHVAPAFSCGNAHVNVPVAPTAGAVQVPDPAPVADEGGSCRQDVAQADICPEVGAFAGERKIVGEVGAVRHRAG
jgi:hypothetical protein